MSAVIVVVIVVIVIFIESNLTCSDVLFCLINSPKPKYIQFTMILNREQQHIGEAGTRELSESLFKKLLIDYTNNRIID